jgi:hypothetical protein
MEEDFSHLLQVQENKIEFVFSHDEIQDSVAKLFQTHTRFSSLTARDYYWGVYLLVGAD